MRRYLAVCGLAAVVGVVGAFGFSPLLKVPFAKQGEPRVIPIAQSKFAGENALATPSLRFPLLAGGTLPARFPSRSVGNLQEGGNCKLCPCDWYNMPGGGIEVLIHATRVEPRFLRRIR